MIDARAQYEIIADRLESDILLGVAGEGGKLPSENKLASAYGVSRPVIREALKTLKARGLISGRQGAPTVVIGYGLDTFKSSINRISATHGATTRHVYEMRIALEVAAAGAAAQNAEEADLDALKKILDEMRATPLDDVVAHARLDTALHVGIAKASRNPLLSFTTQAFAEQVEQVIRGSMSMQINSDALGFHEDILNAIANRDGDGAERLMRAHLTKSLEYFLTYSAGNKEEL